MCQHTKEKHFCVCVYTTHQAQPRLHIKPELCVFFSKTFSKKQRKGVCHHTRTKKTTYTQSVCACVCVTLHNKPNPSSTMGAWKGRRKRRDSSHFSRSCYEKEGMQPLFWGGNHFPPGMPREKPLMVVVLLLQPPPSPC